MDPRQFRQDAPIAHGTAAQTNIKLTDIVPLQHEDLANNVNQMNKINIAQCLCEPYAVCNSNNPSNGAYVATCVNFPDFSLSFTDGQGNTHNYVGLKVRVMFTYGITYGSVSGGTYPTLNINGSGAIPLLAQGKTMGAGAISAGQTVEFTIIPYGNSLAFDADSNVREANSDYTVYTDGQIAYTANFITNNKANYKYVHIPIDSSISFVINGYYFAFLCYGIAVGQDDIGGVVIGEGNTQRWRNAINSSLLPTLTTSFNNGKTTVTIYNNTAFEEVLNIFFIN